jgi:hypothetical protein
MRLKDINAAITVELWMKPELSGESPNLGVGYIAPNNTGQAYRLRINGRQWSMVLRDASAGKDLNFHLKRGCAHLAEVMQVAMDGSALVKIIFFNGEIVEIGDVEIGIDERIESTAKRNGISFNGAEELDELLSQKCSLNVGDEDFFFIYTGMSVDEDFDYEEAVEYGHDARTERGEDGKESSASETILAETEEELRSFSVCGEGLHIPVQKKALSQFEQIFFASKVVFRDQRTLNGSIRLARGKLKFTSTPDRIRSLAAGALSQLIKKTGSYLKKWDEYGAIEGELFLKKAKLIGEIKLNGTAEQTTKGVKLFLSEPVSDALNVGEYVEWVDSLPDYLNECVNWERYRTSVEANQSNVDRELFRILEISSTSIVIELGEIPKLAGHLIWSTLLEETQIKRRMKARSAILEGRCANPLLGLLIEEGGIIPDIQRVTKMKPLTSFVKEKIFKHPPTDRQVEAIDVALNTPDIALIQGPPGTGKTTVVTAILERLNEEYDKTKSIKGQILVSGFQHDAVENIVARLSVNVW